MSADFAASSETPETGLSPTPPQGGFVGHSGDDWDFFRDRRTHQMPTPPPEHPNRFEAERWMNSPITKERPKSVLPEMLGINRTSG
jgi:hypothetical protein